jgi:predicted nucleotidyltransferase component of viral defense system
MTSGILTKEQIRFLDIFGKERLLNNHFYLTGGTPLTEFYLHHRYSEDLDFFSEKEVDPLAIQTFFKKNKNELGFKKVDFQQSYNRNLFFLHYPTETLKTEFTYFPFPRIDQGIIRYGISIDSLLDIAVNKLFTIYQRTKARDYIDLYAICKKEQYAITDLLKKAKIKFDWHIDPLQLGSQFLKAKEAEDMPRFIKKISNREWQEFFLWEAKKMKKQIFY